MCALALPSVQVVQFVLKIKAFQFITPGLVLAVNITISYFLCMESLYHDNEAECLELQPGQARPLPMSPPPPRAPALSPPPLALRGRRTATRTS